MTYRKISILFLSLFSLISLPSCFEDDIEDEDIVVEDRGGNKREQHKGDYEKGDEDEKKEDEQKEENTNSDFLNLKGVYAGKLFSPDPDDEPSMLDVTVGTNKDGSFNLALYNAVVTGLELGDLVFEGIPAQKNEKDDSWTFTLKGQEVSLLGGSIQAKVDVEGSVTKAGKLKFAVMIDEPQLTLNYEGDKKAEGGNGNAEFLNLKGVYAGKLFSPDPDDEPSELDVTVGTNSDNTFNLALYDAVVTGLELGDLVFEGIPSQKDEKNGGWSFMLKGQEVSLMGGAIEATVDVDGTVSKAGELKFSVTIDQPTITLNYEGKKK